MNKKVFREKSLNQMASPDDLDNYLKVVPPGLWLILIAVILLLTAALLWGSVAKIEAKTVEHGQVVTEQMSPFALLFE
ncbi:MAG: hypothetical protein Q4B73_09840 [Lachnospiraceae bacterium]|nr:hypothetical protein [Lachnospiraceae bacterium]